MAIPLPCHAIQSLKWLQSNNFKHKILPVMSLNCTLIEDLVKVKQIPQQFYKRIVIIALLKFHSVLLLNNK
jgi:hypothetical protein